MDFDLMCEAYMKECDQLYAMETMWSFTATEAGTVGTIAKKAGGMIKKAWEFIKSLALRLWNAIKSVGGFIRNLGSKIGNFARFGKRNVEAPDNVAQEFENSMNEAEKLVQKMQEQGAKIDAAIRQCEEAAQKIVKASSINSMEDFEAMMTDKDSVLSFDSYVGVKYQRPFFMAALEADENGGGRKRKLTIDFGFFNKAKAAMTKGDASVKRSEGIISRISAFIKQHENDQTEDSNMPKRRKVLTAIMNKLNKIIAFIKGIGTKIAGLARRASEMVRGAMPAKQKPYDGPQPTSATAV